MNIWIPSLLSVFLVSAISYVGILGLSIKTEHLKKIVILLVSFSAGALMGDVFIHLFPEMVETSGFPINVSLSVLAGIVISFIMEKIIAWRHCHLPIEKNHIHHFAYLNLIGDGLHNFIDGLIIGASYLVSFPVGMASTLAIVLHEIPQEIGDFGVLIHGGFSKSKALFYNFISALTAILGTIVALVLGSKLDNVTMYLIPFAAGTFIYIAGSDLIPELHKDTDIRSGVKQTIAFIFGIAVMMTLLLLE